jgi:hypothetical protein
MKLKRLREQQVKTRSAVSFAVTSVEVPSPLLPYTSDKSTTYILSLQNIFLLL